MIGQESDDEYENEYELSSSSSSSSSSEESEYREFSDLEESDEEETYDIHDREQTLRNMLDSISASIAENTMSEREYSNELLNINYHLDLETKTYVLSDEDQALVSNFRAVRKRLSDEYVKGEISEQEFDIEYNKILRAEYKILKMSESTEDTRGKKIYEDIGVKLEDKLELLHKEEVKQMKRVANKLKITPPKIPEGYTEEDMDKFILEEELSRPVEVNDYIQKYNSYKSIIDYNSSSYELSSRIWNVGDGMSEYNYTFKTLKPQGDKLSNIKTDEKRSNILTPDETRYSERVGKLVEQLYSLTREELLSCIPNRIYKYMSFIERLRENKQKMFRFKEHPQDYTALKYILGEENYKYYKIESTKIFNDYIYNRPDWLGSRIRGLGDVITYTEKGSAAYLAYVGEGRDAGDMNNFVTVKPMDDELYLDLQKSQAGRVFPFTGDKTDVIDVWELRFSMSRLQGEEDGKKDVVRRYIVFEEYLKDLKDILAENSRKLKNGETRDILLEKIRKINYYINYNEDPDLYIQNGHRSVSDIFKNHSEVNDVRKNGLFELTKLISPYCENGTEIIDKLEEETFNYSSSNYNYNISKIIFILKNHQDKLEAITKLGTVSAVELLTLETPKVLPEDDLKDISKSEDIIQYLLDWKPNLSRYNQYSSELEDINWDIEQFRKDNTQLTNLEINEIFSQYTEKIQWENSIIAYNKLNVPRGYIENNYRARFLLKQRNKLPSRRIYRIASISERIDTQTTLRSVFISCDVNPPEEYSRITEIIIYNISRSPEEYKYNVKLVKDEYSKLCDYFSRFGVTGGLEPSENQNPFILTQIITEFIITQGDFSSVDQVRLDRFIKDRNINENIINYIKQLRGPHVEIYGDVIINTDDSAEKRAFNYIRDFISYRKIKQKRENQLLIDNTYIPPIVSKEKPEEITLDVWSPDSLQSGEPKNKYQPEYIKLGEFYISGGFYPDFERYYSYGPPTQNYTKKDLEDLATIFNVPVVEDSYILYSDIMRKRLELTSTSSIVDLDIVSDVDEVTIRKRFNPVEYNSYYEYLKLPAKNFKYTIRPRIGVQEPGDVYAVVKDMHKKYGIPFKYTEDTIPVYSLEIKKLFEDSYIIIEGPCIFEEEPKSIFGGSAGKEMISDSYILVEYLDSRGSSKLFREGVSPKSIITKSIEDLDSCSRFKTENACNDINSWSLGAKGLKFKCKWLNQKCKEVLEDGGVPENFDISSVIFGDYNPEKSDDENIELGVTQRVIDTNKLWKEAINASINYVEDLTKIKYLNADDIKILTSEQRSRLYMYSLELLKTINEISVPVVYDTDFKSVEELIGTRPVIENKVIQNKVIDSNYLPITIYRLKQTQMKYPNPNIKLNKEYNIGNIVVIPIKFIPETNVFICKIKDSSEEIEVELDKFRIKTDNVIITREVVFCYISKEDNKLLNGVPGYYWSIDEKVYDERIKGEELVEEIITNFKSFVPLSHITPTEILNGKPLITRDDIYEAMYKTAFNKLSTEDEYIYKINTKVLATKSAIKFAITHNIDINELRKKIVGTITLGNVLEEYEILNPKPSMSIGELTNIMEKAVEDKDFSTIAKHYVRAKTNKLPKELLDKARTIIDDKPVDTTKDSKKNKDIKDIPKITKKQGNSFVPQGRR